MPDEISRREALGFMAAAPLATREAERLAGELRNPSYFGPDLGDIPDEPTGLLAPQRSLADIWSELGGQIPDWQKREWWHEAQYAAGMYDSDIASMRSISTSAARVIQRRRYYNAREARFWEQDLLRKARAEVFEQLF